MKAKRDFFFSVLQEALHVPKITSVVEWAEENVLLPGSARSERYDGNITPWTKQPIEDLLDPYIRMITMCGPVQSGKSVIGEIALCFWIATLSGGDIQNLWPDDEVALARWDKRLVRILRACMAVAKLWPSGALRNKAIKGQISFPHLNFICGGVFSGKRVASDSIRCQLNEELHLWAAGRLAQAFGRTTAYWDSKTVNISSGSIKGDQLHQAFEAGTQQYWQVKCPGCGLCHPMRIKWEDKHPELGGLRYESTGCRRDDGSYDYPRLLRTLRYQMPCGYPVGEDPKERRMLSLSGQYGEPVNQGSDRSHHSYVLQAVSVDYIPWLRLVQEKHQALKALKYGDLEPYKRYVQERECGFWDPEERPIVEKIVVTTKLRKNREGLMNHPNFMSRFFALDRQQGKLRAGELPHWWLVIRDVLKNGDSQLVFESKVLTDEDVVARLDEHKCVRRLGVADSGDDTMHVYQFCLKNGVNAVKGGKEQFYAHQVPDPDNPRETITVYRIYSVEKPLYEMVAGSEPTCENPDDEPRFWFYSKGGIRQRLDFLRAGGAVKWEVPEDVSEDYHKHMAGEELVEEMNKRGYVEKAYHAHTKRIDLRVCEAYIAMLMEMSGCLGLSAVTDAEAEESGVSVVSDEAGSSDEGENQ